MYHLAALPTGPFVQTDQHLRLARIAGRWRGKAKTYADPSNPNTAEVAPLEGQVEMLLGGRFLRFTYVSQALGEPLAGELTIAYEKGDRMFRTSWIDSLHTSPGILVSEGKPVPEGIAAPPINVVGTYFAGEGQPRWGWRTEVHDETDGALSIRMFNIMPSRNELIGVEFELKRDARGYGTAGLLEHR
jgi:hypothetical protein